MADWLLALLDAAGVKRAVLAGHSMGSLVALEAAARARDRATQLLMLGTAYPMVVSQALLDTSKTAPLQAIDMVVAFSHSTLAAKPSFPGPGVWLQGGGRALMRLVLAGQGDPLLFHTDFSACNNYRGGEAAAARVQCPVHLILGRSDQMTPPRAAQALVEPLRAQVHVVTAGHALMAEAPDPVLNAVRQTLKV
jgi:pimeloyl-ACP methyl ester carboxylesterase